MRAGTAYGLSDPRQHQHRLASILTSCFHHIPVRFQDLLGKRVVHKDVIVRGEFAELRSVAAVLHHVLDAQAAEIRLGSTDKLWRQFKTRDLRKGKPRQGEKCNAFAATKVDYATSRRNANFSEHSAEL